MQMKRSMLTKLVAKRIIGVTEYNEKPVFLMEWLDLINLELKNLSFLLKLFIYSMENLCFLWSG